MSTEPLPALPLAAAAAAADQLGTTHAQQCVFGKRASMHALLAGGTGGCDTVMAFPLFGKRKASDMCSDAVERDENRDSYVSEAASEANGVQLLQGKSGQS